MLNKTETIASDIKGGIFKKSFSQRFVDYLGLACFNSMPAVTIKK